ncbi:TetR/AcrR family transcriptional regulator [Rhodococcus sp. NPDC019627]|uniref:TetR/AcrR family transcriptional regulator n=1 Tax=unclassified Rhodococcus (in: high G+C Gram-positive bacteria) TaxID=192944 RepID=UPI0033C71B17
MSATDRSRAAATAGGRPGNQRADAQRNRIAILAATPVALRKNPEASVADIAAEAGVGRMTLYGHFKTRAELIEAAVVESLERGDAVLSEVPLDGEPMQALARLVESSWSLVDQSRALLAAAQKELSASRIRELHQKAEARMRDLLERGQREGAFRGDLPVSWLLTTAHVVMNAAAEEITAGRLDPMDAAHYINAVLQPAFAPSEEKER